MIRCPRCGLDKFYVSVSSSFIILFCASCARNIGYTVGIGQYGEEIMEYEVSES